MDIKVTDMAMDELQSLTLEAGQGVRIDAEMTGG